MCKINFLIIILFILIFLENAKLFFKENLIYFYYTPNRQIFLLIGRFFLQNFEFRFDWKKKDFIIYCIFREI